MTRPRVALVSAVRTPDRRLRRRPARLLGAVSRLGGDSRGAAARIAGRRPGGRGDHGQRLPGRQRPQSGARRRDQGGPALPGAGHDHQQGVWLRPQGDQPGGAGDHARRRRLHRRRRHGVDEPRPLPGLRRALGRAHGARQTGGPDAAGRAVGLLRGLPHGQHRGEAGAPVPGAARRAGPLRAAEPAALPGGPRQGPVRGRDRAGGGGAAQGAAGRIRCRRVAAPRHQRRGTGGAGARCSRRKARSPPATRPR